MKSIPVFFNNINRSAMVIIPKKPFKDWLLSIDQGAAHWDITEDADVYLLPDFEEIEEAERWLEINFDLFFSDQLNNWYTAKKLWPKNRTFKMFKEWFDYSLHTMVWDILDDPIEKI
ncbi:MAG TPA: hypothetical protein PLX24_09605 [Bacteroidales bacterium]|nr:MAG: hypothetical protein BWX51_02084 [Bacteroidetes bacterium ADurb.Bin012]HNU62771.1 hypothetical protein [Methanofastidiosum sp.]HNV62873.1 hypothetical protein [Candidatus Cloacimonas acidaminovorans]HPC14755.1 hypothetical protein [Bacteroidales bacterium]HPN49921.1 hypothetical protein [Bacteroidales bacterium]